MCCERGAISLRSQLLRSAYVCGESIKLKATIDNQGDEDVRLKVRLFQVRTLYWKKTWRHTIIYVVNESRTFTHNIIDGRQADTN